MQYVQAAGLSEADLAKDIAAAEKDEAKEKNRRQFLNWGTMTAASEAVRKAKKKGGGDGGKKGKKKGRR